MSQHWLYASSWGVRPRLSHGMQTVVQSAQLVRPHCLSITCWAWDRTDWWCAACKIANPTTAIANTTPTVTFDGFPMTAIGGSQAPTSAQSNTSKIESEMFYLNDAILGTASGSVAVSVTLPVGYTPTGGVAASCSSFFGMAQAGPETVGTAYSGSRCRLQTAALSTLATSGDLVIDSFAGGYNLGSTGKSASPNAGQTQLVVQNLSSGGLIGGSSYEVAAAAGGVMVGWAAVVSRQAYSAVAFAPIPTVNYTVTTGVSPNFGGTISLTPNQSSYASGSSVTVTATPAPYYTFTGFTGDLTGITDPATLTVDSNKSVTATFAPLMCALTIAVTTGAGNRKAIVGQLRLRKHDQPHCFSGCRVHLRAMER